MYTVVDILGGHMCQQRIEGGRDRPIHHGPRSTVAMASSVK